MPQGDTLTLLGLGFAVFFGALRVSSANRALWILIPLGYAIIATGCGKTIYDLWESLPIFKLLIGGSLVVLGVITWFLTVEAYRSANVQDYIVLWERNGGNWDNSDKKIDSRLRLSELNDKGIVRHVVLKLSQQDCPAQFTPVIETQFDSLQQGVEIFLFIQGAGLTFDDTELNKEWRPVLNDTRNGQKYWGVVDQPIHYGKSKKGPDGIIKVLFPVGDYRVDYNIQGESKKGCVFSKKGHFFVHIYDGEIPSKEAIA
ncbi:MAG: hypothetical protein E8D44_02480 [Nitrospira sp.]|nr:MAG: hypothetical protein E8D44_02480 [Nitrospira sp.]